MKSSFDSIFTSPKIREKIKSEQFRLSDILLDERIELGLSFEEIAEIAGFEKDEYIKLEYGNVDIPVSDYKRAIKNIGKYKYEKNTLYLSIDKVFQIDFNQISYQSQYDSDFVVTEAKVAQYGSY